MSDNVHAKSLETTVEIGEESQPKSTEASGSLPPAEG